MTKKSREHGEKATLVITYNSVKDFPAGTYHGPHGPVIVYSHDNTSTWDQRAEGKLSEIVHGLYGRINSDDIKKVYLYVGLHAKEGALRAARTLSGKIENLTLVACDCDSESKEREARKLGVNLIWSECGGRHKLKNIVEEALK